MMASPVLPKEWLSIFRGNLFVGCLLHNESRMENCPLTLMTVAKLLRVLQRQTKSKVGYRLRRRCKLRRSDRPHLAELRKDGVRSSITDIESLSGFPHFRANCAAIVHCRARTAGILLQRSCLSTLNMRRSATDCGKGGRGCRQRIEGDQCAGGCLRASERRLPVYPLLLSHDEAVIDQAQPLRDP